MATACPGDNGLTVSWIKPPRRDIQMSRQKRRAERNREPQALSRGAYRVKLITACFFESPGTHLTGPFSLNAPLYLRFHAGVYEYGVYEYNVFLFVAQVFRF